MATRDLRVGVLGGGRGLYLGRLFAVHPHASTVALCERDPGRAARAAAALPGLEVTGDFDDLLARDVDVVVVANDAIDHVPFVLRALAAGKHVLSEVMACRTLAEAVALVRAVESAPGLYSYAENCCTMRPTLEMGRLFRAGALGQYLYGECEYVHDCIGAWSRLTYGDPGHWRNGMPATGYCSHALGPMIEITRTRPVRCVGMTTPNLLGRAVGRRGDDMGVVLCQMSNGAVTKVLVGMALRREPPTHWYSLYGTLGHVENTRGAGEERVRVYLARDDGSEDGRCYLPTCGEDLRWASALGGHGGADALMVDRYVCAVLDGGPPPIDVYMGLDMTLPGILGYRSAYEGNVPLEVPDLRDEAARARYADDTWSPYPQDASPGQPASPSAHGPVDIAQAVYDAQRRLYEG